MRNIEDSESNASMQVGQCKLHVTGYKNAIRTLVIGDPKSSRRYLVRRDSSWNFEPVSKHFRGCLISTLKMRELSVLEF